MNDYDGIKTTLIHANVDLEFDATWWTIKVYDEDSTYSKLFFKDEFPLPKDLGDTLVEFLEKYYVKCTCEDGNSSEEDKDNE